ncbi:MAG: leucine-rich repeat protein, partial [Bacteroidales bacterium]|nr:leucine-rich repeat protein [Bacteroidales bacterium]
MDKNLLQKAKAPMIALILFNLFAFNMIAKAQNTFGGGSGTYMDPYIISTTDHWIELASSVNAVSNPSTFFNQYFRLDADLDFNGISFQPVGNCFRWFDGDSIVSPRIFSGKFNGNGHSIKNVTYHSDNDFENGQGVGLFGYAGNAFIQNLTLAGNSTITGYNHVGGIVGKLESNSTVTNCLVEEGVTIAQAPVSSCSGTFGGIVGMCMGTYIFVNNCFSYATVAYTCDEATPNYIVGVGGVVGATGWYNSNPIIEIRNCGSFGQVTGITYVGAICGYRGNGGSVTSCYVGGNCTTGAIGVQGSQYGTDEGIDIKHVCAIFCGKNVGATYHTQGLASCNGKTVYEYNESVRLTLEYTGAPPTGYTIWDAHYEVDGGTLNKDPWYPDYIDHANNRYILRLPSQPKSTITFVSLDLLRDISYEPWVRITVPACLYTGENHTPQPLVIDTKDGASDTLRRNIDYSISAGGDLDPSYCDPGNYSILIEGKGDFRGDALKVFTIFELDPDFSEGSGTETDPYIIRTTEQMDVLAAKVNAGDEKTGVCFRLEADLDYTGKTYTPVGNANYGFRGIFDGNGHTISNVNLNINQDNVGLFGSLGGTVKNLTFDNSNIQNSGRFIGGIAGSCNGGTIKGCIVTNNVNINGTQNVGGIVGEVTQWGRIDNCLSLAQSIVGSSKVGGIAGDVSSAILTNNYYAGYYNVGGINGNDVTGAVRGYAITSENGITVGLEGSTGLAYGGVVYGGQGQEIVLTLNVGMSNNPLPQCYSISAGILTYNDNGTYTVILPMQNVIIGFLNDLIESNGMHYLLSCDDSHTAILIHSDSYATMEAISVEDFEYQGTQYTVTEIAANAFDGCEHLKWFDCHSNILSIGDHAFRNCDSLEYVGLYEVHTPPTVGEG